VIAITGLSANCRFGCRAFSHTCQQNWPEPYLPVITITEHMERIAAG